jgi:serine/threonine-protein kinase RsbW
MPTPTAASLDLPASAATYPGRPEQVRQVRADARGLLAGCPAADEVILCLSELAANAVLHSGSRRPGGTFSVRIESCPGAHIRIEVEDDGGPWLAPVPHPDSGRGLDIIRVLAAEWGVATSPAGRTVWARFNWPSPRVRVTRTTAAGTHDPHLHKYRRDNTQRADPPPRRAGPAATRR